MLYLELLNATGLTDSMSVQATALSGPDGGGNAPTTCSPTEIKRKKQRPLSVPSMSYRLTYSDITALTMPKWV